MMVGMDLPNFLCRLFRGGRCFISCWNITKMQMKFGSIADLL